MIPVLLPHAEIPPLYLDFLDRLTAGGFAGDIERGYAARLTMATDNSAFQQLPQAVLFPRSEDDIAAVFELLDEPAFHGVYLAPRGGGTSTIGCSLTEGLVLDCSRHLNRILEIDIEAGFVRVEPGVVLDQLNDALAEHSVFFAPNVAPSSRATLGGMTNTDGCGKGSRVYGKTSDHVLASRLVLADGSRFAAAAVDADSLNSLCARDDAVGHIHREARRVVTDNGEEIERSSGGQYTHLANSSIWAGNLIQRSRTNGHCRSLNESSTSSVCCHWNTEYPLEYPRYIVPGICRNTSQRLHPRL